MNLSDSNRTISRARMMCSGMAALLAALSLTVASVGADTAVELRLAPSWRQGDVVHYRLVSHRVRHRESGPSRATVTTPVSLTVKEAGADGYLVEWVQGRSVVEGTSAGDPLAEKMRGLTENTALVLELSADGRLKGLRNWEAVRARTLSAMDVVLAEIERKGMSNEDAKRVRVTLTAMVETRQQVEAMSLRDVRPLFMLNGLSITDGGTESDVQLANPLGGPPVPATRSLRGQRLVGTPPRATVSWTERPGREALATNLRSVLTQLAAVSKRPITDPGELAIEMSGEGQASIDLDTGWPISVTQRVTLTVNGLSSLDERSFERVTVR